MCDALNSSRVKKRSHFSFFFSRRGKTYEATSYTILYGNQSGETRECPDSSRMVISQKSTYRESENWSGLLTAVHSQETSPNGLTYEKSIRGREPRVNGLKSSCLYVSRLVAVKDGIRNSFFDRKSAVEKENSDLIARSIDHLQLELR